MYGTLCDVLGELEGVTAEDVTNAAASGKVTRAYLKVKPIYYLLRAHIYGVEGCAKNSGPLQSDGGWQ